MATPVGHILAGLAIGASVNKVPGLLRRAVAAAFLAAAPDLDFLPGILVGQPARFHHAQTHSLGFVFLVSALVALAARRNKGSWAALAGVAYASHLLLDILTVDDGLPYGIPLFWPLSVQTIQSPVTLLPRVPHSSALNAAGDLVTLLVLECALFAPLAAWAVLSNYRRPRRGCSESQPGGTPDRTP